MEDPTRGKANARKGEAVGRSGADHAATVAGYWAVGLAVASLAIVGVRNAVAKARLRHFCQESHAGAPLREVLNAARRRGLAVDSATWERLTHGDEFFEEDVLINRQKWFGWRGETTDEPIATVRAGTIGSERWCAVDHRDGVVVATRLLASGEPPRTARPGGRRIPPRSSRNPIAAPGAASPSAEPAQ